MGSIFRLRSFRKTIAVLNTAEPLSTLTKASEGRFASNVTIHAPSSNSATVYIGGPDVNATVGFPLVAGATLSVGDIMKLGTGKQYDLSQIYVFGAATNVVQVIHELEV
jgi:hypothetical protein